MNGLGRNSDNDAKKQHSILTNETLGVVLILFATLCLVCLITRDAVFSLPGRYVNAFLHGCFGWFAYAVVIWLAVVGVGLVTGKKSGFAPKKKVLLTLSFFLTALLLHVITMRNFSGNGYGEYLAACYTMAEGGFSSSSAGGICVGFVAYFFSALLTNVGSYVVVGICLAVSVYFLVKSLVTDGASTNDNGKFRSSFVKKEAPVVAAPVKIEGIKAYPVETEQIAPAAPQGKQKLFVNNPSILLFAASATSLNTKRTLTSNSALPNTVWASSVKTPHLLIRRKI